ncbi:DJ-1 family glyoxalase III [Eubacterium oxidoreducens]|uniref:4-methyl-5(B-hydroxyethyl)-thiazole monophosphate biosynthesis n=1 Tax=Eubacterium oxidoreducens TaxID=1732 RepID=A0A1G6AC23_EUBOX|nr:DJ-1 family glyoxalase III [Eubacterium oxidoreducens]SDB05840.1 4-methyl-5(b-hydroxyethyl)-thiazole monophosphate biosynthesis [Eubacterium oxidoreducens]
MKKAAIFLADGFEDVEALATVDVLRRADVIVDLVNVEGCETVKTGRGITLVTDKRLNEVRFDELDALILPGGLGGYETLLKNEKIHKEVKRAYEEGKLIAAICAAPGVLGKIGILNGKKATIYPGMEKELDGAIYVKNEVTKDGNIITAPGMGKTIEFALAILEELEDASVAKEIAQSIVF